MEENQEIKDITEEQGTKQRIGYKNPPKEYQWKKGVSANPGGRPTGKSLKTFAREYLESLPDNEKIDYLKTVDTKIVWEMAEGKPKQDLELNAKVTIAEVLKEIENEPVIGQTVALAEPLQDTGQEEEPHQVQAEQSPAALPASQVVEKYNPQE